MALNFSGTAEVVNLVSTVEMISEDIGMKSTIIPEF